MQGWGGLPPQPNEEAGPGVFRGFWCSFYTLLKSAWNPVLLVRFGECGTVRCFNACALVPGTMAVGKPLAIRNHQTG